MIKKYKAGNLIKNLYKWIMLGALLVSQISVQASNFEDIDKENIQKSRVKAIQKTEQEDYQKGIINYSFQKAKDISTNLLLISAVFPNPLGSRGAKQPEIKVLNFRNNLLTDSGAINLACCLDHLKELEELDVCENSIGTSGIQAIFIKALSCHKPLTFKFTASKEVKKDLRKIEQKYKVSAIWLKEGFVSDNLYDYEILFKDKYQDAFDLEKLGS